MRNDRHPRGYGGDRGKHCTAVEAFLRILHRSGDVFEVRSIDCPERAGGSYVSTNAGWFSDPAKAAKEIERIEKLKPPAVYVTVHPVEPALLGRSANRCKPKAKHTTKDSDVVRRRWLFVDIDPKRPAGVSSTESERAEALRVAKAIRSELIDAGWPEPLRGMSGNGIYLLWRIDLPNDEDSTDMVKRCLEALARQFDTEAAEVDSSTHNASRVCKVLGTVARKGDPLVGIEGVEDRPHRQSWFIEPDEPLQVVMPEQLQTLADQVPAPEQSLPKPTSGPPAAGGDVIERAKRYIAKMPEAVEGEKGSDRLFAVACKLVIDFALSADDALFVLATEYNPRCVPPWSVKDLRHKVEDAAKKPGVRGRLLRGDDASPGPDAPWDDPEPLPDPLCSVMPYRSELLPPEIGGVVDDVADRMQCPPDFPAAAMLVALAAVIGARVGIRPKRCDDWLVVPNLWGAVVGRPSLKKSPAIAHAESRVRAIEARERERLAGEVDAFRLDAVIAEASARSVKQSIAKAVKKGDQAEARRLAMELQEQQEATEPKPRRIITTDSTIEKLGDLLNQHPAGMLLWVDELVGWMRGLDRPDMAGVRQQFLTLWNGKGRLNIDRVGRGETVVDSPCLSVFGCCTPGGLSEYVTAAMRGGRGDDGLVQRLQVLVWPDSPREYQRVDRWPDSEARDRLASVFEALADLDPEAFAERDRFDDGSGIPWVRFDSDGQAIFDLWDSGLQSRIRSGDLPEAFESHLSKYASMVPSIALVLHLASGGRGPVSGSAAELGVRWAEYLESHASRLFSVATAPERQLAKPLLKKLIDWPKEKPIRSREIVRRGWSGLNDRDTVENVLGLLADAGWVRAVPVKPAVGRSTTDWMLHPRAADFLRNPRKGTDKTDKTPGGDSFGGFVSSDPGGSEKKASGDDRVRVVL